MKKLNLDGVSSLQGLLAAFTNAQWEFNGE